MLRFTDNDVKSRLKGKAEIKKWIGRILNDRGYVQGEINVILCSDKFILDLNKSSLGHDYYTDIITFDYCEGNRLSGDLFISVDSVRENAAFYGVEFADELNRVIVHGLLHLIGYDDHTEEDVAVMRAKENYYLSQRPLV